MTSHSVHFCVLLYSYKACYILLSPYYEFCKSRESKRRPTQLRPLGAYSTNHHFQNWSTKQYAARRIFCFQYVRVGTTNGGSSGCLERQWREQLNLSENLAEQWPHDHGCWPLWTSWWRRRTALVANTSLHSGHCCRLRDRSLVGVAFSTGRLPADCWLRPCRRWRQAAATALVTNACTFDEESSDVADTTEWLMVWTGADAWETSSNPSTLKNSQLAIPALKNYKMQTVVENASNLHVFMVHLNLPLTTSK